MQPSKIITRINAPLEKDTVHTFLLPVSISELCLLSFVPLSSFLESAAWLSTSRPPLSTSIFNKLFTKHLLNFVEYHPPQLLQPPWSLLCDMSLLCHITSHQKIFKQKNHTFFHMQHQITSNLSLHILHV